MRLFIGIPIPEEYLKIIGEVQGVWRKRLESKVSWVRPELAHLTLKFLGEVDEARVAAIVRAMRAAAQGIFEMQGRKGGFFPPRGAPRVVWVGFSRGQKECGAYFAALDNALAGVGFSAETRPFAAHVTVARVREAVRSDDWPGLAADLTRDWPVFEVKNVVLWQSVLRPSGPEYRRAAEVTLGA
ncbi:MAG: RNA 2',3'-cyclic phosphodiesterase [Desulfovibrionales bacterium]|nr:RNA 2',3'-cyclic phosphodiesterase [Desulfovibrionales bacterium]